MRDLLFLIFGSFAVLTALGVILLRSPLTSAFFLILCFLNLAGLYVLLEAHFLAIAQILVYAGAIMVLFVFVIMLLNVGRSEWAFLDHREPVQLLGVAAGVGTLWALVAAVRTAPEAATLAPAPAGFGQLLGVARTLFGTAYVAFELVGVLLFVATVAVVLLAKRVV